MIYLHSDGIEDPNLLGQTFEIKVYLINELEQRRNYIITILTFSPYVPTDQNDKEEGAVGEGGNEVEIEELPVIENIGVEYAVMD